MLILFLNLTLKKINKIFIASIIFFVAGIFLAQPIGRFFIEPFLWAITGSLNYSSTAGSMLVTSIYPVIGSMAFFISSVTTGSEAILFVSS